MISYLITFTLGLAAGFVGGLLVFRKHRNTIDQAEARARSIADEFKK